MTEEIDGGGPLVTGIVARGRTVCTGNDRYFVGHGNDRIEIENPGKHVFAAGEEIQLNRSEFDRLHALGYVRRPGEPETRPGGYQDGSMASLVEDGAVGSITFE